MRRLDIARVVALVAPTLPSAQTPPRPRGRELGIPFPGTPGPLNAITDVTGVAVGHVTRVSGEPGPVVRGKGPIRTGVTAILPRAKGDWDFVMAATFNQNGNGDMTGVNWVTGNSDTPSTAPAARIACSNCSRVMMRSALL